MGGNLQSFWTELQLRVVTCYVTYRLAVSRVSTCPSHLLALLLVPVESED